MATLPEISQPKKRKTGRKKNKHRAGRTAEQSAAVKEKKASSDREQQLGNPIDSPRIEFLRDSLLHHPLDREALIDCWPEWQNYLGQRGVSPFYIHSFSEEKPSVLLWGVKSASLPSTCLSVIKTCERVSRTGKASKSDAKLVETWFESVPEQDGSVSQGLAFLAVVQAMPALALRLEGSLWIRIAARVIEEIELGESLELKEMGCERILRAIELPLLWAYTFPELVGSKERLKTVRKDCNHALRELLDGEGAVRARDIERMPLYLATWTRSSYLAQSLKTKLAAKDATVQFEWLIREAVRWSRPDRSVFLTESEDGSATFKRGLLEAALRLSSDKDDLRIAKFALDLGPHKPVVNASALPDSSAESTWAETAILRGSWHPNDVSLAVDYSGSDVKLELFRYEKLLLGTIRQQLTVDGLELPATSGWNQVCWHEDDDVSYLEIEKVYGDQVVIQRQFVLGKQDRIVLFSEAIACKTEANIEYRCQLPVASECDLSTEKDSREGSIHFGRRCVRVLPISAPEWRSGPSTIELEFGERSIDLSFQGRVKKAYVPLFFDLEPRRYKKPYTWRQLTVARERTVISNEEAVGFRVQSGKDQWLVYRSLAPVHPRTVLGEHINSEFYMGQFFAEGECIELISVESDADD